MLTPPIGSLYEHPRAFHHPLTPSIRTDVESSICTYASECESSGGTYGSGCEGGRSMYEVGVRVIEARMGVGARVVGECMRERGTVVVITPAK